MELNYYMWPTKVLFKDPDNMTQCDYIITTPEAVERVLDIALLCELKTGEDQSFSVVFSNDDIAILGRKK